MSDEKSKDDLAQELGTHLLDVFKDPSLKSLGKANGAVGSVNLVVILFMFAYQFFVVPTKAEMGGLKRDIADVRKTSVSRADLDRAMLITQKDFERMRVDVRDLKSEMREAALREPPSWLIERLNSVETDIRTLRNRGKDEEK